MKHDEDPKLSKLLDRWEVTADVPRDFRSSVWSKIASRQEARENHLWHRASRSIAEFFARPLYASAAGAAILMFSVGAAHLHAESVNSDRHVAAESAYWASISPLAQIGHDGQPLTE